MSAPKPSPLVSVCVPTYNGAEYLRACLAGLQAQTLPDFEVLVVDDDSTDGTLAMAAEFARNDPRYHLHRNPRRLGLVGNWNHCLELARGQWIKFLFQDDLLEPRCLERLVTSCQQRGQRFGFCRRRLIFEGEVPAATRAYFGEHQHLLSQLYGPVDRVVDAAAFARMAIENPDENIVGEPTVTLFHRSVIPEFGLFVPALVQRCDLEYWLRLGTNIGAAYVAEFLATFRIHDKSATSRNLAEREYVARVLDPLIAHHHFLTDKPYAAFRQHLFNDSGRMVHWWRFIWMAHKAWKMAGAKTAGPKLPAQWQHAVKTYPHFKTLAMTGRCLMPIRSGLSAARLAKPMKKYG